MMARLLSKRVTELERVAEAEQAETVTVIVGANQSPAEALYLAMIRRPNSNPVNYVLQDQSGNVLQGGTR